jgi:hypothetical protein
MLDQGTGYTGEHSAGPGMLGLWYDPERLVIEGVYQDELSAYRARRRWIEAMEKNFLLDDSVDFSLKVRRARGGRHYRVRCDFTTACGRYAFWRLTHHQAPEVQFLLETAHLPHSIPEKFLPEIEPDHDMFISDAGIPGEQPEYRTQSLLQRVIVSLQGLARRFSDLTKRSSEV